MDLVIAFIDTANSLRWWIAAFAVGSVVILRYA